MHPDGNRLEVWRLRWNNMVGQLFSALPFWGIDMADVIITGDPFVVHLSTWADLSMLADANGGVVALRSSSPRAVTVTIDLGRPDDLVVADILESIGYMADRHHRLHDTNRETKEQELVGMVTDLGLVCTSIGPDPLTVLFRDSSDRLRGRLVRSDFHQPNPAYARFTVSAEAANLSYAHALRALAAMRSMSSEVLPLANDLVDREPPNAGCAVGV